MRVWRKALALLAAVCLLPLHAGAAGAPAVSAGSAILVDGGGGRVLQPGVELLEPASDFPKQAPLLIITDCECDRLNL